MLAQKFPWASLRGFFLSLLIAFGAVAEDEPAAVTNTNAVAEPVLSEAELAIKKFKVAEGFKVELFASEPLFANPVAFSFDEKGRVYVAETFRIHQGVYDIRHHMNWLDEELASLTLEDHQAKIKNHISDVGTFTNKSERLTLIEDSDGDGKADKSTVFADGYSKPTDGIASGVLARKGDVYFTCIPDLYLLRDNDADGKAEQSKSLHTGYGVRFGFLGHDLHGLIIGPDGRLYFSIGDRGFHVKQGDRTIAFPEGGAILRCNLDGSGLEIFAYGHRNPQELAFDKFGNLFTGDNNSDAGDQARWVYLVEGGDSGWRIGFQFINEPTQRGPWNAESMWDHEKAPKVGYIVPPLANLASGPSGLAYYPGVGLPEKYDNHFFLCDFKGSPASEVHSFANEPNGASFKVVDRAQLISELLSVDVTFGPDCSLYVSDWVEGWDMTGKGRLYRLVNTNADATLMQETKKLINEGMGGKSRDALLALLSHPDQRVRQEAQFALVEGGALRDLVGVAEKGTNQLARIHAIWGVGQFTRGKTRISDAGQEAALKPLSKLLADNDAEVRAQAAKILGEAKYAPALDGLIKLVGDVSAPRGQFFAAMALGKLGHKNGAKPIIEMLRGNDNKDAYLRHAGVMGLVWISDMESILAAARDTSSAVRVAAAVAMRRLHRAEISMLLNDKQQEVVVEAARAVNDLPIIQSLPDLAKLIEQPNYDEALFRRVLNANCHVGTPENALSLAKFAGRADAPEGLRTEALQILHDWSKPSARDRVTGLWRPIAERDSKPAVDALKPLLADILKSAPGKVQIAAIQIAQTFQLKEMSEPLLALVENKELKADVRGKALAALAEFQDPNLAKVLDSATRDEDEEMRKQAVAVQAKANPGATAPILAVLENGTVGEKQNAFTALGDLPGDGIDKAIGEWMDKLIAGEVPDELKLDLLQAAEKRSSAEIKKKVEKFDAMRWKDDLGPFRECLVGGNAEEGKKIFFERVEASCLRCHKVGPDGGEIGPVMDGIGSKKTRDYILLSIVNPNAEIAAGFESVIVTTKDGQAFAGTLKSEDKKELVINSPEDGIIKVAKKNIDSRERGLSGMPPEMAKILSKQDLRNLIEYLANLK